MSTEPEAKALLRDAGIPVPRGVVGLSSVDALTPPLVLKAFGGGLVHKSDVGAVVLGLAADEVPAAAAAMTARLAAAGLTPDGFLVEEQAEPGLELIVGVVRDPGFGPVLLVGLGGVWTEAMRDTALRLCPVSEPDARRMLASLRGAPLLYGYRGGAAVDVDAVVKLLLTVGGVGGLWERLDLGEFELNPLIASPSGVIAVDARYLEGTEPPTHHESHQDHPPATPAPEGGALETSTGKGAGAGAREGAGAGVGAFLRLFEPRAVAVVGASTSRPNFGNMFLEFYQAAGMPVVAVHPSADDISGVPAVRSLAEADVDYALVAVPAERCAEVLRQAGGVPYVQVMSSGFGEMGNHAREAELVRAADDAGVRLLGPNCLGVYSPRGRQTFIGGGMGEPGSIAMVSQSGGLAGEVIKVGERRGLRFSRVATVGNAADVTPAELLRWLDTDPETSAVGMYLEDPREGRDLFEALSATDLPTVLLVGGRSGQGQRAAASHTGGMVSDSRIWQALADQTGATLVTSQDDLIGALAYFQAHAARLTTPGDGVLVIGPSGGASVLAADVFDRQELRLDPLPADALDDLRGLGVGVGSSLANPLEIPVGPRGRAALAKDAITAIVRRQPYPDVVAHVNVQSFFTYGDAAQPLNDYAEHLARAQSELPGTRITLVTRNGECAPAGVEDEVRAIASAAGIPVYRSMEAAAVAVRAGQRFCGGTDGTA